MYRHDYTYYAEGDAVELIRWDGQEWQLVSAWLVPGTQLED